MRYPKFTRLAQNDLFEISDYIADDNSEAAQRVVEAIEETAMQLVSHPDIGRSVESNLYEGLQSVPCNLFPIYQILFLEIDSDLTIVRVLHGARDMPRLLND